MPRSATALATVAAACLLASASAWAPSPALRRSSSRNRPTRRALRSTLPSLDGDFAPEDEFDAPAGEERDMLSFPDEAPAAEDGGADRVDLDAMVFERADRFYNGDEDSLERAFLIGLDRKQSKADRSQIAFSLEESLGELAELAATAGLLVVGSTYQRVQDPNPRTYIGSGKVKETRAAMAACDAITAVVDGELSPGQQRNLEEEFGGVRADGCTIKVLDRTALILDIFAQHAKSREGQLQVELALHVYRLPRLTRLWTHLERQASGAGGGAGSGAVAGLRGPGETQIETDRRLLRDKISSLKREIESLKTHRTLRRQSRRKLGVPVVALCGYTNAGKSTLLNRLSAANVLAEDMLFATLDPVTRRVKLPAGNGDAGSGNHPEALLTDTVGFVQKLPTQLVAAFKATLEEVTEADVIVQVVDISAENWAKQQAAVLDVLAELEIGSSVPIVTLWNKLDRLDIVAMDEAAREARRLRLTVAASAVTGEGMDEFLDTLKKAMGELLVPVELSLPFARGDLLSEMHAVGTVETEAFGPDGVDVVGAAPKHLLGRLEPYRVGVPSAEALRGAMDPNADVDWKAVRAGDRARSRAREAERGGSVGGGGE